MFELEPNVKTIKLASKIYYIIIIILLYALGLYYVAYTFMLVGCSLVIPYDEEESDDSPDHVDSWSDEILFYGGETPLNPLLAFVTDLDFEPDYILDLMDMGMVTEDNTIASRVADKKYHNELRIKKFLQKSLKLYSSDESVHNNYLRFNNISANTSILYSDNNNKKYQEKINYYNKAKNDLESLLVKRMKKEGWSEEFRKEAQFTSIFLCESYISSGLYPYSTEAYNISFSKDYIVDSGKNINDKILHRKKVINSVVKGESHILNDRIIRLRSVIDYIVKDEVDKIKKDKNN